MYRLVYSTCSPKKYHRPPTAILNAFEKERFLLNLLFPGRLAIASASNVPRIRKIKVKNIIYDLILMITSDLKMIRRIINR